MLRHALSSSQQGLWFLSRIDARVDVAYNVVLALRASSSIDPVRLQSALRVLQARHEALRCRIVAELGVPAIEVEDAAQATTWMLEQRAGDLKHIATEEGNRPFEIGLAPLARAVLVRPVDVNQCYGLVFVVPHLLFDDASARILMQDLQLIDRALLQGEDPMSLAPPGSLLEAIEREQALVGGQKIKAVAAATAERLEGMPERLALPGLIASAEVSPVYAGAAVEFELSAELVDSMRTFMRQQRCTPAAGCLAAFLLLLWKVSGQVDFGVNLPVSNRGGKELQQVIGYFTNVGIVRAQIDPMQAVSQFLARLNEQWWDLLDACELPFPLLAKQVRRRGGDLQAALMQVGFNHLVKDDSVLALGTAQLRQVQVLPEAVKNQLKLDIEETPTGLRGVMLYDRNAMDRETVQGLADGYVRLLESMVAASGTRLRDLPLLGEAQRNAMIERGRGETIALPRQGLHKLFEEQVERSPDAVAVVFEDQQLTYGQLNARANQLAHHLRGLGVKPDTLVAICVERSLEMVIGLLGILKAGGAYVPLDPGYPEERLAFMLEDTDAPVLVTQAHLTERMPETKSRTVCIDSGWSEIDICAATNPPNVTSALNLAYCIYTSGSTGRPKGVGVEHSSVVNLWGGLGEVVYTSLPPQARIGCNAAIYFDASVQYLCQSLNGNALVLMSEAVRRDPMAMVDWLHRQRIDAFDCTPKQLELLCQNGLLEDPKARLVVVGGEAVDPNLWQLIQASKLRAVNVYGPTECTVDATWMPFHGQRPAIGRPIANTQVYLLDECCQPVAIGVAGEICIAGAGLARGYLNRPDLTAEKFVPDPFGEPGTRMYKTGDLARYLPDGNIEFLGRIDHQVKIRGFRIELGEIEEALRGCEGVREAVAQAREDEPGDKRLVAYVVPMSGAISVADLRNRLSAFLPEYMVPAAWVFLDALPLNSNGKIDHKALPAPELSRDGLDVDYVAPRNSIEELLAGIWAKVLKVERIGVHDNFFALGGHSLLAMQVVSRIRTALNTDLPLRVLFEASSLAALADRVSALRSSNHVTEALPSIRRTDYGGRSLASFAQRRLWFIDQYESSSGLYNIPAVWRLRGALDVRALQQALNELVRRHETLRTAVLVDEEQQVVQVVADFLELTIKHTDLSAAPQPQAQLRKLLHDEANGPFDLSAGPLVRCGLVRLASEDHVLLLTMHHIVSDGWSMGVLTRELQLLYTAFTQSQPSPLTELPIQYADYAQWQREWLQGEALQAQVDFWRMTLEGAPPLIDLPLDRPRPVQLSHRGAFVPFELDAASTAALRKLCQQAQVTAFMAAAALLNVLLHRYSRQDDICFGYPVAGRQRKELEGLIGFFVNTLVLRTRIEPRQSFLQLLAQVRESVLDADDHQDLPFEKLVEELKPERSLNHSPLFQVMLAYNNAPGERLTLPGLEVTSQNFEETQTAKFDLTLELTEAQDHLLGTIGYNIDLFDRPTIERMVGHFKTLLEAVVADPHSRVQDLPLLTETEQHQILVEWNDTKADFAQDKCIHQLFEEQVERSPDAVAVVFEDQQLTYGQLNARANQLAHHLRGLGVKPDTLVAICVERSLEMVIGLLGILKAGGAYVPLDPGYPTERLLYMLQNARTAVLVTQEGLAPRLSEFSGSTVLVDPTWSPMRECSVVNVPCINDSRNLAYCLYTSGSTGLPKGVELTHRNAVNFLTWVLQTFGQRDLSTVACTTSICFDLSVFELFGTLVAGGIVVLLENALSLLSGHPSEPLVTINTVPSAIGTLAEAGAIPAGLQVINLAGEPLQRSLVNRVFGEAPGVALFNLYGPTEYTTYTTVARISAEPQAPISLGHPIANTRIYILNEDIQLAPIGVAGEICIAGEGLARGYLKRPDLTATKFVPNPFGAPGERMYRTGDVGRYLENGEIEFVGRVDHQVKVRGFRIELGEIEVALQRCEGIRETVVLALEDESCDMRLAAYVVSDSGAQAAPADLRAQLSRFLPSYMLPTAWVFLDALPLNQNGKIDRKALKSLEPCSQAQSSGEIVANEIELRLARVWSEVLSISQPGIGENFFEIGGHSLNVATLRVRIFQEFGLSVPLKYLFERQTISEQAKGLNSRDGEEQDILSTSDAPGPLPLTPAQSRFLSTTPDAFLEGNVLHFLLTCDHELKRVIRAISRILSRHTAFRISQFAQEAGEWRQIVSIDPPTAIRDLGSVESIDAFVGLCLSAEQEISLARGVFYRWCVGSGPASTYIFFACHHLIADAISLAAVKLELDLLFAVNEAVALPPPTSLGRWIKENSSPEAMAEYYSQLPRWERNVSRESRCGGAIPTQSGTPSLHPITLSHPLYSSTPSLDHIIILAAVVHAFAHTFTAETVHCRVVDSGRGNASSFDDSMTVGWLAHHVPLSIKARVSTNETVEETRAAMEGLARRGMGYGWLRFHQSIPTLVDGLQLTELPLYFNHLYAETERYRSLSDVTSLLKNRRHSASEPFRGLAVHARQSRQSVDLAVSFDDEHIGGAAIEAFVESLKISLSELTESATTLN